MYPAEGREDGRTCSRSLLVVFQVFSSFDTFSPLVSRRVVYCGDAVVSPYEVAVMALLSVFETPLPV